MISSETLNLLQPNLVGWCIIMSQIVFQKDWFAVFKVTVTIVDNISKICFLKILSELLILLQVDLMPHHHKVECVVKRLDCSVKDPQWGAADAEIKVPSCENTELKCSPFQAWSRSVYSHTCYAYCQGFLSCLFLHFRSIHLHFFQNLSRNFSCVGCS